MLLSAGSIALSVRFAAPRSSATAEVFSIQYVDPLLSDVVPFLVLIVALIVRPWGLFGTREELDRV